jgi:hypothetical protein
MKLIFLYSPDATREMTSRLVISGSTMASRPAAAVVDHHDEILHAGDLTSSARPKSTMAVFPKNGNKSSKNSEKQKLRREDGRDSRRHRQNQSLR